jgi:hypothetical protein
LPPTRAEQKISGGTKSLQTSLAVKAIDSARF